MKDDAAQRSSKFRRVRVDERFEVVDGGKINAVVVFVFFFLVEKPSFVVFEQRDFDFSVDEDLEFGDGESHRRSPRQLDLSVEFVVEIDFGVDGRDGGGVDRRFAVKFALTPGFDGGAGGRRCRSRQNYAEESASALSLGFFDLVIFGKLGVDYILSSL